MHYEYRSIPPLSLLETANLNLRFSFNGLTSALNLEAIITSLATRPNSKSIQANLLKSSLLQSILLLSTLCIDPLLTATIGGKHTSGRAALLFHILFLYPLVLASLYFSGLYSTTKLTSTQHTSKSGLAFILDQSYRPLILLNYFIFAHSLRYIPYLPLAFLFTCLANAYYLFETQWINQGMNLPERIQYLEQRWAFFLGFGLPITTASYFFTNPLVSFSIFSLLFSPSLLLTSTSHPLPIDPSLPSTASLTLSFLPNSAGSSISIAAAEGGEEMRGRPGSIYFPARIRIFIAAEMGYRGMQKLLGGGVSSSSLRHQGGGGAGVGMKKDAGVNHGGTYDRNPSMGHGGGWRSDLGNRPPASQWSPQLQRQTAPPNYAHSAPQISSPPTRVYNRAPSSTLQATAASAYSNPLASLINSGSSASTIPRRTHQASESSVGVVVPRKGSGFDNRGTGNGNDERASYGGVRGKGE